MNDQFRELLKKPEKIPARLDDLNVRLQELAKIIQDFRMQPLKIDFINVVSPETDIRIEKSTFIQRFMVTVGNFIASFRKDYNRVGEQPDGMGLEKRVLKIWVALPKEYAEALRVMAGEDFTPNTGILADTSVMPSGQVAAGGGTNALILSLVSGNSPDIVIGSDALTPAELAFRGSVVDLAGFRDFPEIEKRFIPGIMEPYKISGGVYAIPDRYDFPVMIYRSDILNELGITLPDTWDEIYRYLIPVLNQNGMKFYYQSSNAGQHVAQCFLPLLYQNGGSFYSDDFKESALTTDKAYKAFEQWTRLYTLYGVDSQANVYTHFRNGKVPVAIANFTLYNQILNTAPELFGKWNITLVPGTMKADGSIDRTFNATSTSSFILKNSKMQEGAWDFLKWWTSADVQRRFGLEIESLIGKTARWNTANTEAFDMLPWEREHIGIFREQRKWYRDIPSVIGGYYTGRYLLNSWTRTVLGHENLIDVLDTSVKAINKEMKVKREEYDIK